MFFKMNLYTSYNTKKIVKGHINHMSSCIYKYKSIHLDLLIKIINKFNSFYTKVHICFDHKNEKTSINNRMFLAESHKNITSIEDLSPFLQTPALSKKRISTFDYSNPREHAFYIEQSGSSDFSNVFNREFCPELCVSYLNIYSEEDMRQSSQRLSSDLFKQSTKRLQKSTKPNTAQTTQNNDDHTSGINIYEGCVSIDVLKKAPLQSESVNDNKFVKQTLNVRANQDVSFSKNQSTSIYSFVVSHVFTDFLPFETLKSSIIPPKSSKTSKRHENQKLNKSIKYFDARVDESEIYSVSERDTKLSRSKPFIANSAKPKTATSLRLEKYFVLHQYRESQSLQFDQKRKSNEFCFYLKTDTLKLSRDCNDSEFCYDFYRDHKLKKQDLKIKTLNKRKIRFNSVDWTGIKDFAEM